MDKDLDSDVPGRIAPIFEKARQESDMQRTAFYDQGFAAHIFPADMTVADVLEAAEYYAAYMPTDKTLKAYAKSQRKTSGLTMTKIMRRRRIDANVLRAFQASWITSLLLAIPGFVATLRSPSDNPVVPYIALATMFSGALAVIFGFSMFLLNRSRITESLIKQLQKARIAEVKEFRKFVMERPEIMDLTLQELRERYQLIHSKTSEIGGDRISLETEEAAITLEQLFSNNGDIASILKEAKRQAKESLYSAPSEQSQHSEIAEILNTMREETQHGKN